MHAGTVLQRVGDQADLEQVELGQIAARAMLALLAGEVPALALPAPRRDGQGWVTAGSTWVALSRDPGRLQALVAAGDGWRPPRTQKGLAPWSDDFASVLPVLRWRRD